MLWEDFQDHWSARLVEFPECPVAVDETPRKALAQLKETLTWHEKEHPWDKLPETDFLDPVIQTIVVPVQSQYEAIRHERPDWISRHETAGSSASGGRVAPVEEPVRLLVACVLGRERAGVLICAIPLLGICFNYYKASAFEKLVRHYVCEKLQGRTPAQLTRFFPPKSVQLDELVVSVPRQRRRRGGPHKPELPTLEAVAVALGDPTVRKQYSRAFERNADVTELARRLEEERANVLLLGDPGVGKTSILVDAVRRIERKQAELGSRQRRFWQTNANRVIAGMKYLGEWEERCETLIEELSDTEGVLCLDDLVEAIRTGGSGPGDSVAGFFMPYLQHSELRMVCEATPAGLDACQRVLPGFVEWFQVLRVPKFDKPTATRVLARTAESLAQVNEVTHDDTVPGRVHHLFARFLPYHAFPGKAVDFMRKLWGDAEQAGSARITDRTVMSEFMKLSGLPEIFLSDDQPLDPVAALRWFGKRILGQPDACQVAADLVTLFKSGLNDPTRPVSVLFFCGPTGVGKTATARAVADFFFGHGEKADRLIRLDMSEYGIPGAADRLLGEAGGRPSDFISRVRGQPFSVVLLDEIEKADPDVFDMLLNVLDEGRLTDKFGRLTTFRSAIIIMTSNAGAKNRGTIGFDDQDTGPSETDVMNFFRPEFYNRIDRVVQFRSLDRETVAEITRKELGELAGREGFTKRGVRLVWTDRLVEHLAREGFDPRFGARLLQRKIEELVVTPLARHFVDHPASADTTLEIDFDAAGETVHLRSV